MSVIPLIIEGADRTIVTSQEDFDTNGTALLIQEIDMAQFQDATNTNTCYDLRIGSHYRDHRDAEPSSLNDDSYIEIYPGEAFIVETEEAVHFPKSFFGYILPKVTKLQDGISNTSSKVDPGYHGTLLVTIFNLGKKTIKLKRKEKFCSLHVVEISNKSKIRLYNKKGKQIKGEGKRSSWQSIGDFCHRNDPIIKIALSIITIILLYLQIKK